MLAKQTSEGILTIYLYINSVDISELIIVFKRSKSKIRQFGLTTCCLIVVYANFHAKSFVK